jgi:hypothetical protein
VTISAVREQKPTTVRCGKWSAEPWPNGLGWDIYHTCHTHYECWNDGRLVLTRRANNLCGYEGYQYCKTGVAVQTGREAINLVAISIQEREWQLCEGIELA